MKFDKPCFYYVVAFDKLSNNNLTSDNIDPCTVRCDKMKKNADSWEMCECGKLFPRLQNYFSWFTK